MTNQHAQSTCRRGAANTGWLLLVVLLTGAAGFYATKHLSSPTDAAGKTAAQPDPAIEVDPELGPKEVVHAQMSALATCREDPGAIARVFAYASPSNKAVTGPLDAFEKMVWREPYAPLIVNQGWTVGGAVVQEHLAAVLVSVIDQADALRVYRFYLSHTPDAALEETDAKRWMTDAVIEVTRPPSVSNPEA